MKKYSEGGASSSRGGEKSVGSEKSSSRGEGVSEKLVAPKIVTPCDGRPYEEVGAEATGRRRRDDGGHHR